MKISRWAKRILALVAILALAGCATPRIDWTARMGHYSYDQAVKDFGSSRPIRQVDGWHHRRRMADPSDAAVLSRAVWGGRPLAAHTLCGGLRAELFHAPDLCAGWVAGGLQRCHAIKFPLSPMGRAWLTRRMNVDLGIWSTLTKVVVGLVVIAVLLLMGIC